MAIVAAPEVNPESESSPNVILTSSPTVQHGAACVFNAILATCLGAVAAAAVTAPKRSTLIALVGARDEFEFTIAVVRSVPPELYREDVSNIMAALEEVVVAPAAEFISRI